MNPTREKDVLHDIIRDNLGLPLKIGNLMYFLRIARFKTQSGRKKIFSRRQAFRGENDFRFS